MIHPILGRIVAVVAAAVVTYVLDLLGVPVSDEQKAGVIAWLTDGLTALGGFVALGLYGAFHKTINKRWNPQDTAVS